MARVALAQPFSYARTATFGHSIRVQRRSGSSFIDIPADGSVKPLEPIRFASASSFSHDTTVQFRIEDASGKIVGGPVNTGRNPAGNHWWDTVAPGVDGSYTAFAKGSYVWTPTTHIESAPFRVSKSAPAPPSAPPGGGNILDALTDLAPLALIAIIAVAASQGVSAASRFAPRRGE